MRGKKAAGRTRIVVGLISAALLGVALLGMVLIAVDQNGADLIMESRAHGSSGPGRKGHRGHPGGLMGKPWAAPRSMKTAPLPN
ncbi:hypothetical protein [Iodidimonas nitroreducens]|nr:hypothetical protein [Iodidimonas nitroreducens]